MRANRARGNFICGYAEQIANNSGDRGHVHAAESWIVMLGELRWVFDGDAKNAVIAREGDIVYGRARYLPFTAILGQRWIELPVDQQHHAVPESLVRPEVALPAQPAIQLNDARAAGAIDLAKRVGTETRAGRSVVEMVQEAKRVGSNLQIQPFTEPNVPAQRDVEAPPAGAPPSAM